MGIVLVVQLKLQRKKEIKFAMHINHTGIWCHLPIGGPAAWGPSGVPWVIEPDGGDLVILEPVLLLIRGGGGPGGIPPFTCRPCSLPWGLYGEVDGGRPTYRHPDNRLS